MSYSGICNVHDGFSMRVWLWISMALPMVIEVLILILSMDLLHFDANTTDAITVATAYLFFICFVSVLMYFVYSFLMPTVLLRSL